MNHSGQFTCLRAERSSPSVLDVFERFIEPFRQACGDSITLDQRKALQAIFQCRTAALGGRCYACPQCGDEHFAYHSCNHRLCPQCGTADTQEWVSKQLDKLLPVPYFMVTFTLPEQLRPIMLRSRAAIELFFQCSSQALHDLPADPKRTGFTRNGFFGVYQSWGQNMIFHPHIHYIVPAVGLDAKEELKHLKNPQWLLPAQPLATRLRTLLANKLLDSERINPRLFRALVKMDWNVSVDPAGSGENAVKYLGNYVQRSVISDQRILSIEGEQVRIGVRNRATGKYEPLAMTGVEFIRRYLLHTLPKGFHRIRYRGFLHARGKSKLQWLQLLLDARICRTANRSTPRRSDYICRRCGTAMELVRSLARAPPAQRNEHFFNIFAA